MAGTLQPFTLLCQCYNSGFQFCLTTAQGQAYLANASDYSLLTHLRHREPYCLIKRAGQLPIRVPVNDAKFVALIQAKSSSRLLSLRFVDAKAVVLGDLHFGIWREPRMLILRGI